MEQVLDRAHRGFRHGVLHGGYKGNVVFAVVADDVESALHHVPFLQLLAVEPERDFLLCAGEFPCQAFHPPVRGEHIACREQPRRGINPKGALVLLPLLNGEFYFGTGKIQRTLLIVKVPRQYLIDYLPHLHLCSPAFRVSLQLTKPYD